MKFTIDHVGKIEHADIELKPLTVFIGENNTGKTYAASSIWSVISYIHEKAEDFVPKKLYEELDKTSDELDEFFRSKSEQKSSFSFRIKTEYLEEIMLNFNQALKDSSQDILRECFKFDSFEKAKIAIGETKPKPIEVKLDYPSLSKIETTLYFDNEKISTLVIFGTMNLSFFKDWILKTAVIYFLLREKGIIKPLYIPAARTGLMYGIHDIIGNDFRQRNSFFRDEKERELNLTAPLVDFIASINDASSPIRKKAKKDNANLVKSLIQGDFALNDSTQQYEYQPENNETNIPLPATSSLITELSPLSILDVGSQSFVFFEEPEAHLHLSAQREMAKIIVELVNQGCHMLITTHSDTFLQQLNNLMMLNKVYQSKQQESIFEGFSLQEKQTISHQDVAVYDFQCSGDKTVVKPIEFGDYGFVAESLNKVLISLSQETNAIIDKVDELNSGVNDEQ